MNDRIAQFLEFDTLEDWDRHVKSLSRQEIMRLEKEVDMLAQAMARLSEYLTKRGGAGGSDYGRDQAMLYADERESAVRKALGYED